MSNAVTVRSLLHSGLTLPELLMTERLGGSITEGCARTLLFIFRNGLDREEPLFFGDTPDQQMRLKEIERLGNGPDYETRIDLAEEEFGVPAPMRLKRAKS